MDCACCQQLTLAYWLAAPFAHKGDCSGLHCNHTTTISSTRLVAVFFASYPQIHSILSATCWPQLGVAPLDSLQTQPSKPRLNALCGATESARLACVLVPCTGCCGLIVALLRQHACCMPCCTSRFHILLAAADRRHPVDSFLWGLWELPILAFTSPARQATCSLGAPLGAMSCYLQTFLSVQ